MKGNFRHISFEQRKVIASMIRSEYKLKDIGKALNLDPTSVSKEVKRNRIRLYPRYNPDMHLQLCKKLDRFPYVCNTCKDRYSPCPFEKYEYKANEANQKANSKLILSRRGIDSDSKEFKIIDEAIKKGIENGESVYQIVNANSLGKSVSTIYRYINSGYLTTRRIDLPLAVTYKARKKTKKKYDYDTNKSIDRSNHTYLDYLSYIHENPGVFGWQLDFLGSIRTDRKSILTLIMAELHFPILHIIEEPNSAKVVRFFDELEEALGIEDFRKVFPYILTDRDPCFADMDGICFSKKTKEERTKLFYCDPYVSNQKPHIENLNRQLRIHYPKGKSIDHLRKIDIKKTNMSLLDRKLKSMDGYSAKEAFIKVYGNDIFIRLMKS
ncbi:MAG: helix-turn-helix domain-containing protein [Firmicutes bacterium]|nr:helix-turn-helix domain-containing protein [Bacillota bacterium]